jgi:hypothetical protein
MSWLIERARAAAVALALLTNVEYFSVKASHASWIATALSAVLFIGLAPAHAQQLGGANLTPTPTSIPPSIVYAATYGVFNDPTCSVDQTLFMVNAIAAAAGKDLVLPSGATICLKTAGSTLQIASTMQIDGSAATIAWDAPAGTNAAPMIDVLASAPNTRINNLNFNHNWGSLTYTSPSYFGVNLWGGVALVIEGNGFQGANLQGVNGFNNCIGIGAINRSGNTAIPNAPVGVTLTNIQTKSCGVIGPNAAGGAGVDNGSGGQVTVTNATDNGSAVGFVNDIGAGPSTVWANLFSINAYKLTSYNGTGTCLYDGSGGSAITNVNCSSPGWRGVVMDAPVGYSTTGTVLNNVVIHSPQDACLQIRGAFTGSNIQCLNPSQEGSASAPGVLIDAAAGTYSPLIVDGLNIYGSLQSYAIQVSNGNDIGGHIRTGPLNGVIAATSIGASITHLTIESVTTSGRTVYGGAFMGFGAGTPAAPLDILPGSNIRISGASGTAGAFPTTGEGIEFTWQGVGGINGNYGIIQAYDRTNAAWRLLDLETGTLDLNVGTGSQINVGGAMVLSALGIDHGYTIAGLPTCNGSTNVGAFASVTNGVSSPTYHGAVSTTGSSEDRVYCAGSAGWVYGG